MTHRVRRPELFQKHTLGGTLLILASAMAAFAAPTSTPNPAPATSITSPRFAELTAPGSPHAYSGAELATIAMPVGGIYAGQLYFKGDGSLFHWDIMNGRAFGASTLVRSSVNLQQGFSVRLRDAAGNVTSFPLNLKTFPATTIPDRFPETEFGGKNEQNHRIYSTTTTDFKNFTPARLFFDPGFNVIDSILFRRGDQWVMFIKEESKFPSKKKNIRLAVADDIEGPFQVLPAPLTPAGSEAEGPAAFVVDCETLVYFDAYSGHRFEARSTRDWKHWEDISTRISLPVGIRHGTVFSAPPAVVAGLRALPAAPVSQP